MLGIALIFAVAAISYGMAKASSDDERTENPDRRQVQAIEAMIRAEAARQGVPAHVALATAWVESRMRPNAEGDKRWHDDVERYRKVVPRDNPYRAIPKLWHSYGLFQLLAPYHVRGNESPLVLLDVATNIQRGVKRLKELLAISKDLDEVRLRYVGATRLSSERQEPILHEWRNALQRYMVQEHVT